jgi:N-methylhydantoinase A
MPDAPHSLNEIAAAFQAVYEERYAQSDTAPAEIVSFRVVGLGRAPSVELPEHTGNATADIETRPVSFDSTFVETAIHHREALPVDAAMPGPTIIEEDGATTVVPPGFNATLDRYGILTLRRVNHD